MEVSQDPYEPDMQSSYLTTNDGDFDIANMNIGDTIGYAYMNTDGGDIISNSSLIVTGLIGSDQAVISAWDSELNSVIGNFSIGNNNPGISIIANSPADGNNVTGGNLSLAVFEEVFINPSSNTTLDFNSTINSELGDIYTNTTSYQISCATGINDAEELQFSLFPNPTTETTTIQFDTRDPKHIEVFSTNGQQVLSLKSESKITELDVSSLMNGIYILKISSVGKTQREKLIIQ